MLQYLVDESHRNNLKVCAHVTYADDYKLAIETGIDNIHHAAYEDMLEEDIDHMVKNHVMFVPTLSLLDLIVTGLNERWVSKSTFDPPVSKKIYRQLEEFTNNFHHTPDHKPVKDLYIKMPKGALTENIKIAFNNLQRFSDKGENIALGTDAALGFSFHGCPVRELELIYSVTGSIPRTIRAATYNSAKVFSMENEIGAIEAGRFADLLIVNKDIIEDIKDIRYVIQNGDIIK